MAAKGAVSMTDYGGMIRCMNIALQEQWTGAQIGWIAGVVSGVAVAVLMCATAWAWIIGARTRNGFSPEGGEGLRGLGVVPWLAVLCAVVAAPWMAVDARDPLVMTLATAAATTAVLCATTALFRASDLAKEARLLAACRPPHNADRASDPSVRPTESFGPHDV